MGTFAAKNLPHKLAVVRSQGFDVAGIDGSFDETWSVLSPQLPDPEGLGHHYQYRDLFKIGSRFYVPFATTSDTFNPNVYVYSWASGEPDWTFEFSESYLTAGGSMVSGSFFDSESWDCACDGTDIYIALTVQTNHVVTCSTRNVTGTFTEIEVFKGHTLGTWSSIGLTESVSFDLTGGAREGLTLRICASAGDPGNVYLAAADGGPDPCDSNARDEHFWVQGFGASPSIPARVFIQEGSYDVSLLSGSFPLAHVRQFDICNDGDDVQVFYRRRLSTGFDETTIRVIKPGLLGTASQGETNQQTGPGFTFFYEDSLLDIATVDTFTMLVTPLWAENSGRRQRALIASYTDGGDVRGIDADGVTVHHLHDNTALDSTAVASDHGVQASIAGPAPSYIPGFYYDPTGDEYWAIYRNPSNFRSSVTTAACGPEQWKGVSFDTPGFSGNLTVGQGPFVSDSFYVLAIPTTTGSPQRPAVVEVPICRGCMACTAVA